MASISSAFIDYFQKNFFEWKKEEFDLFLLSLKQHRKKTLRINTNKISVEDFINWVSAEGWTLTPTENPQVFEVDREDTSVALGSTLQHILGYFYIQEKSATQSVKVLTDAFAWKDAPRLILDMAASPGGKTTQLAEAFPEAFIVANESSKDRLSQLIQNIERMGADTIGVVCDDGRRWGSRHEAFDAILLDAPCSGEGIAWKAPETLAHWHPKKVKGLAKLQNSLIESAFRALKVGGFMVYSTCTLNEFENEGPIEHLRGLFGDSLQIISSERSWPHRKNGAGFFVACLTKTSSIPTAKPYEWQVNSELVVIEWAGEKTVRRTLDQAGIDHENFVLYRYHEIVLSVPKNVDAKHVLSLGYFSRFGRRVGGFEGGAFILNHWLGRDLEVSNLPVYDLNEGELALYLSWWVLLPEESFEEGQSILLTYGSDRLGISRVGKDSIIMSDLPYEWRRK